MKRLFPLLILYLQGLLYKDQLTGLLIEIMHALLVEALIIFEGLEVLAAFTQEMRDLLDSSVIPQLWKSFLLIQKVGGLLRA